VKDGGKVLTFHSPAGGRVELIKSGKPG